MRASGAVGRGLLLVVWAVLRPAIAGAEGPAPSGRVAPSRASVGDSTKPGAEDVRRVGRDPAWRSTWAVFAGAFRNDRAGELVPLAGFPFRCGERQELVIADEAMLRERLTGPGGCLPFTKLAALGEQGDEAQNNLGIDPATGHVTTAITMGEGVDCADWVWAHFERRIGGYVMRRLWTTRACEGGGD